MTGFISTRHQHHIQPFRLARSVRCRPPAESSATRFGALTLIHHPRWCDTPRRSSSFINRLKPRGFNQAFLRACRSIKTSSVSPNRRLQHDEDVECRIGSTNVDAHTTSPSLRTMIACWSGCTFSFPNRQSFWTERITVYALAQEPLRLP